MNEFEADVVAISRIEAVSTILEVVCRITGMRFAAVARVTEDRWITCCVRDEIAFGLKPGDELKIETTLCNEIRASREPVIIDHVDADPIFCRHLTPGLYGFQSYISVPIILPGGAFFGTLCAIDPLPARLKTPETIGMFKLFAELIAFYLSAERQLAVSEASLLNERQSAELREQFIAVLGHDLRNPLASIGAGTRMLSQTPLNEKAKSILGQIESSVGRMSGLIGNVLDFARGRLSGGLGVVRQREDALKLVLEHVIAELHAAMPDRKIETDFHRLGAVDCDSGRIGQLLSNLVGNALTHGAADRPVRVSASTEGEIFELAVANSGDPIAPATIEHLFKPFFRASARPNQQGLGLGLYIAAEIAKAHGGTLGVESTPDETRFCFRMPMR